jgi:hypothetical protein
MQLLSRHRDTASGWKRVTEPWGRFRCDGGDPRDLVRQDVDEVPRANLARRHLNQDARLREAFCCEAFSGFHSEIPAGNRLSDRRHIATVEDCVAPHLHAAEGGNGFEDDESTARQTFEMPNLDIVSCDNDFECPASPSKPHWRAKRRSIFPNGRQNRGRGSIKQRADAL